MNAEKLRRLQSQVRIGGKGTPRRKKKVMHNNAATDDKKLQSSLKKLSVSTIPGIEEVNIIKDDLTVIHFNNPKAQASLSANTFAVTGHGETKKIVEMLPEILPQLGQDTVMQLRMFANTMSGTQTKSRNSTATVLENVTEEDEVPMLVNNFEEVAKMDEAKTKSEKEKSDQKDPQQESIENKENDSQKNYVQKEENVPKVDDKMDKKAKRQQNKQSTNGAAKNKSDSVKNENKQKSQVRNEKIKKHETTANVSEKMPVAASVEKQDGYNVIKQEMESNNVETIADVSMKVELEQSPTNIQSINITPNIIDNKSDKKPANVTPISKEEPQIKYSDVVQQKIDTVKAPTSQPPAQSTGKDTLLQTIDLNIQEIAPISQQECQINLNKVTVNKDLNVSKESKTEHKCQDSLKKENIQQQKTTAAEQSGLDMAASSTVISSETKEVISQPIAKSPSPQPKNLTTPKDLNKNAATKSFSPQPGEHKAQASKEDLKKQSISPQPKDEDINKQTISKGISPQAKDTKQSVSKSVSPQPKEITQQPKGLSPQPKGTSPAPKGSSPQPKGAPPQPKELPPHLQGNKSASSGDFNKHLTEKGVSPQQKEVSPQPIQSPALPKVASPQPKEGSPQSEGNDVLKMHEGLNNKVTTQPPSADEKLKLKLETVSKDNEELNKFNTGTDGNGQTNMSAELEPAKTGKETTTAEVEIDVLNTSAQENKEKSDNIEASQESVIKSDIATTLISQPQIPQAVIEQATLGIDEVIAAAAIEVAKLPSSEVGAKPNEVQQRTENLSSKAVEPTEKKDVAQTKVSNTPGNKSPNQSSQMKSTKQGTSKPNQQGKQNAQKSPEKATNLTKSANVQQKPGSTSIKKTGTSNTSPTTPTETNKATTPTDPVIIKNADPKPDPQKKSGNQSSPKPVQTKTNTTKSTNNGSKPNSNSPTTSGPKKSSSLSIQHDNKQTKQANSPKHENNAAKVKQASPPKTDVKSVSPPKADSKQASPPKTEIKQTSAQKAEIKQSSPPKADVKHSSSPKAEVKQNSPQKSTNNPTDQTQAMQKNNP